MKKLIIAIAAAGVLCAAGTASAADADGKFGIGYNANLSGGVDGIGLNYWIGDLKTGLIVGLDYASIEGADDAGMSVDLGVQVLYAVARSKEANLNTGIRFNVMMDNDPSPADGVTNIGFEIPVEVEYWVSDHFSILGHFGLAFDMVGEDGDPRNPARTEGMYIGVGTGGFSGGVGFNFYF